MEYEVKFHVDGGFKPYRFADAAEYNENGELQAIYQVGRVNKNAVINYGTYVEEMNAYVMYVCDDEYGRLIARTDYNAPNPAAGIPSTHYHIYNWTQGSPYEDPNHYPGEYQDE